MGMPAARYLDPTMTRAPLVMTLRRPVIRCVISIRYLQEFVKDGISYRLKSCILQSGVLDLQATCLG